MLKDHIIDALHDHIQSMYDTSEDEEYLSDLEAQDVNQMLECISSFHDPSSCDICIDLLSEFDKRREGD